MNQPSAKAVEPGRAKDRSAVERSDRAAAAEGRIGEIDGAARIAEIGRAGRGVEPPGILGQPCVERAQLGGEGRAFAPHLAEHALASSTLSVGSLQSTR